MYVQISSIHGKASLYLPNYSSALAPTLTPLKATTGLPSQPSDGCAMSPQSVRLISVHVSSTRVRLRLPVSFPDLIFYDGSIVIGVKLDTHLHWYLRHGRKKKQQRREKHLDTRCVALSCVAVNDMRWNKNPASSRNTTHTMKKIVSQTAHDHDNDMYEASNAVRLYILCHDGGVVLEALDNGDHVKDLVGLQAFHLVELHEGEPMYVRCNTHACNTR